MFYPKFKETIKKGKIEGWSYPYYVEQETKSLSGDIYVIFKELEDYSSVSYLKRYYWACVTLVHQESGWYKDDIHDRWKRKFLKKSIFVCNEDGEIIGECEIKGTTIGQDNPTLSNFIDMIKIDAAVKFGVVLPDSNRVEVI